MTSAAFPFALVPHPSAADFSVTIATVPDATPAGSDQRVLHSDLSPEQGRALSALTDLAKRELVASLGGVAGSGKSTIIPLLAANLGSLHRTAFCAFTGKAANVMKRKLRAAGIPECEVGYAGTLHGLMYTPEVDERGVVRRWNRRDRLLTPSEVPVERIIVDEASMVGEKLLQDVMSYRVPVVLVGDHGQLEPVNDVSVMQAPNIRLEQIHRQVEGNPIIQLSKFIREKGYLPKTFPESEEVRFITSKDLGDVATRGFNELGMEMGLLVRSNKRRVNLNKVGSGGGDPRVGDLVIALRNNPPVFNGMRGIVEAVEAVQGHWYKATILFPDDAIRVTSLLNRHQFHQEKTFQSIYDLYGDYGYPRAVSDMGLLFDFGFALTVHKAQGSSFEEAAVWPEFWEKFDSEGDGYKRWLYTGVTRAAKKLYIMRT
jgi:exodeoxyribonuclease-5